MDNNGRREQGRTPICHPPYVSFSGKDREAEQVCTRGDRATSAPAQGLTHAGKIGRKSDLLLQGSSPFVSHGVYLYHTRRQKCATNNLNHAYVYVLLVWVKRFRTIGTG